MLMWHKVIRIIYIGLCWLGVSGCAYYFRTPLFASIRYLAVLGAALMTVIIFWLGRGYINRPALKTSYWIILLIAAPLPLLTIVYQEAVFQYKKAVVLSTDSTRLEYLSQHFIVGFRSPWQVEEFIAQARVGGVYITQRNVANFNTKELGNFTSWLQNLRPTSNRKLIIATDQEGGIVSHLSPPLGELDSLANIIAATTNKIDQQQAVADYATKQAQDLAAVGITLNLAPVVDVVHPELQYAKDFSQINRRAISSDPKAVATVAQTYQAAYQAVGVQTIYKHFPGLGRVTGDTHLSSPILFATPAEMEATDLLPFLQIINQTDAMIMLSHVIWQDLDGENPVSISPAVIHDYLRTDLKYQGLLMTDDFSMDPIVKSTEGVGLAAVQTLNAGTDIILISYDQDLYYEVMYDLLKADTTGVLDDNQLKLSQERLQRI
ncbi:MAG: hypothetical protein ACD_43C00183G0006 [uncultured bacterium]|nr:MAG: hypothetical protein ACD_43C00183G0006 [uncultured bacterium]